MKKQNSKSKNKKKYAGSENAERYFPSAKQGLSSEQVKKRTAEGYTNIPVKKTGKTVLNIIVTNVFTFFNMIFFVLALILLFEKSYNNMAFMIVVFVNTVIGIVQEIRAKHTLEKLNIVSAPTTRVIREGKEENIKSEKLVLDDIVIFEAGNQICADACVCDGEMTVNESLVTGEIDEIKKKAGDYLLSGSFVISGTCHARLDKVGYESYASKLMLDAKKIKKKQQEGMLKSLTFLIKIIGVIIIPFAILMFINQYYILHLSHVTSVENTIASIIGMIPEGLYLLASVALAVSSIRLAKKKTLVHDMKCIETLARVDTICVDKTGTITEPEMNVHGILPLDDSISAVTAEQLVCDFVMNMNCDNATMQSLKSHFGVECKFRKANKIKGFSSATKYSAASFDGNTYIIGAPEFVLQSGYEKIRPIVESHSGLGERVLLFAEYQYHENSSEDIFLDGSLCGKVIPLAIITLKNNVRPDAKATFEYFVQQGVDIKVISGDNPITVSKAAQEAGIPGYDNYIDASLFDTEEKIEKGIQKYTVFGRVTPQQKRLFIQKLKKNGHTVALTGDGGNDVLALKDADCSVAMASGSEAASNVSDLVLMDSNFSSMPSVVAEGRRVINNIERSAALFLQKNVFSFILSLIALISVSFYPFKPSQLSLISALMIGIPSFILALEPNTNLVKGNFLKNVMRNACPTAFTGAILIGGLLSFANAFDIPEDVTSTMACYLYGFVSYAMLYRVCKPMTLSHKILFICEGVLFVSLAIFMPNLFDLVSLNRSVALILVALCIITFPVNEAINFICNHINVWFDKIKNRFHSKSKSKKKN